MEREHGIPGRSFISRLRPIANRHLVGTDSNHPVGILPQRLVRHMTRIFQFLKRALAQVARLLRDRCVRAGERFSSRPLSGSRGNGTQAVSHPRKRRREQDTSWRARPGAVSPNASPDGKGFSEEWHSIKRKEDLGIRSGPPFLRQPGKAWGEGGPNRFDLRPLIFVGMILGLIILAQIGTRLSARTGADVQVYYAPVLNPTQDSVAYLKREPRFSTTPRKLGLVPGYVFESDRLHLCTMSLSAGEEDCLHAWDLPMEKKSEGPGVVDPVLRWDAGGLSFDIWLREFLFAGAGSPDRSGDPAQPGTEFLTAETPSLWHRVRGNTRTLRTSAAVPVPVWSAGRKEAGRSDPASPGGRHPGEREGPDQDGSREYGTLVVTVYPAQEGRSTLRPNRLRITTVDTQRVMLRPREGIPMPRERPELWNPNWWNGGAGEESGATRPDSSSESGLGR